MSVIPGAFCRECGGPVITRSTKCSCGASRKSAFLGTKEEYADLISGRTLAKLELGLEKDVTMWRLGLCRTAAEATKVTESALAKARRIVSRLLKKGR